MSGDRIRVRIVRDERVRWGLATLIVLLDGYPNGAETETFAVDVEDTVLGLRWRIDARDAKDAQRIRDWVEETAAALTDVQLDEWGRAGRWPEQRWP